MLPKKLQKWDTIWVIVPSGQCTPEKYKEVLLFIEYMESIWLFVKLADDFLKHDIFQTSWWTPTQRADDFNSMVKNPDISVIWCLQWWETVNEILDLIDYEALKSSPKIIIGKSDIDVLHNAIYRKTWLICFHGPDSKIGAIWEMELEYTQEWFQKRFFKGETDIAISDNSERYSLKSWQASWVLIGCNFVSILKLAWTEYFPDFSVNHIFFIETYKYQANALIARLQNLKMLGVFDNCVWVVIGSNYNFEEQVWKAEDIILNFLKNHDFPIMKTNEFGHYQPHAFLPIGAEVYMNTETSTLEILSDFIS